LFEISFVVLLAGLLHYAEQESDQYEQSKDVLLQFNLAQTAVMRTMSSIVMGGSHDPNRFGSVDATVVEVRKAVAIMYKTSKLRPELREAIAPAPELFEAAIKMVERGKQDFLSGQPSEVQLVRMRKAGLPLSLDFEQLSKNLLAAESEMKSVAPKEQERIRDSVFWLLVLGTVISIAISIGAAWFFLNDILKRLGVIEENARLLAMRSPLKNFPMGDDEIASLDTALKQAECVLDDARRKELAILDVATDVICSADKRFRVTAAGAASLQAWGYPTEELLGRSILSLQTKESEPAFRAALEEIARSKQSAEFESQLVSDGGLVKDFLWKVNWSPDNQSFYCVAHDISERRAADRMKQRFIAIVSHDLRTPLSSISATLSVLLAGAGGLSEQAQSILRKAEASLERLMDLIRDLLDLEKLEAGKVVLDLGAVSALDVCVAACDSVEFLAQSLGVKIVRSNKDAALLGDERRLVRVLINLISNAIKFSPRGSSVTVLIENLGAVSEISVSDQGPGIPPEDQELIFEKFRQSKSANTAAVKGTGLGLAIAKLIAEGHNGEIGVQSAVGKGSRFYIRIPNYDQGEPE
jgi:PAS domain S-box-containing protein